MNWWWIIYLIYTLSMLLLRTSAYSKNSETSDSIIVFGGMIVAFFEVFAVYMAIKQGF